MDLKEFSYLITLAENGSVSKAADQLFMAQSSLSQFLHQYESELGVKLFVRTSKGIRPTRNGAVFIGHLKKLMTDYQRAKNELWDCENLKGGRVTLGISSFRGRRILPIILKRFYEKYPDVQVDVVEENIMKLEDLLLDGQLDLAVVAMPSAKLKREIRFLKKDEIFIVTNRNHSVMEIAHRREHTPSWWIDLKDAAKFKFILSDHTTMLGTISRDLFHKEKLQYEVLHGNITADLAVSMAQEGLGLAFTYYSYTEPSRDAVFLSIGEKGIYLDLGLASPASEYHSKAAQALEAVIREVYMTV